MKWNGVGEMELSDGVGVCLVGFLCVARSGISGNKRRSMLRLYIGVACGGDGGMSGSCLRSGSDVASIFTVITVIEGGLVAAGDIFSGDGRFCALRGAMRLLPPPGGARLPPVAIYGGRET